MTTPVQVPAGLPRRALVALLALFALLSLMVSASPVQADASDGKPEIAPIDAPTSITTGMTMSVTVRITTYDVEEGATLEYRTGPGFVILTVNGVSTSDGTVDTRSLGSNTSYQDEVVLLATAGAQAAVAPLSVSANAGGSAQRDASAVAVVDPQISLVATSEGSVFPTTTGTATLTYTNVSASPWTSYIYSSIYSTTGITTSDTPEAFGLDLQSGESLKRTFSFSIARDAPTGAGSIWAHPNLGPSEVGALDFDVQPLPKFEIDRPDRAMTVGGATQKYPITLINRASVQLKTEVKVAVVGGATVVGYAVSQGQFDTATGKWTVPGVQSKRTAVLTLELRAVNSSPLALTVDGYGGPLLDAGAGALATPLGGVVPPTPTPTPQPTVQPTSTPPPTVQPPAPTPTPVVVFSGTTPTPAPATDTLALVVSPPAKNGTKYTFRGSLTYQGRAMTQVECKYAKLSIAVRKVSRGKPTGKPVTHFSALSYSPKGNCAFATLYPFKKSDKGKSFQVELKAMVKVKLMTLAGGQAKPAPVTWTTPIKVGKAV